MAKFVFVTGGVVSALGKGIASASIRPAFMPSTATALATRSPRYLG